MSEYLDQIYLNYEQSFINFKELLTTDYELDSYPPAYAKNQTYGSAFPGALIRKPLYENCSFIGSKFESSDAALSKFHYCHFIDCLLDNCDFRYCDIFYSDFSTNRDKFNIISCNFSYGNFIHSLFTNIQFDGCSFRQMQFEDTTFQNCIMLCSSIEQCSIKNCLFENVDFRKVGVRYCTFEDVEFKSVTFHILDLPRNLGLIRLLQNGKNISIAYGDGKEMSLTDAIYKLKTLIPYYLETQQYYELLNVYIIYNEYNSVLDTLPFAFKNVIATCDFAALQDLCSLIVKSNICNNTQLKKFYTLIKQLIIPDNFPYYLRKSYNSYIENIKHILVDNPFDNPEAHILLKTDIDSLEDKDMHNLLKTIELNINKAAPEVDSYIKLTRHSPYEIAIILCGALPIILNVCQIFYYALGGTKSFSDLKDSLKEKTNNNHKTDKADNEKDIESTKRIELSIGTFFSFKFEKEYVNRVKSMEYTIQ